MTVIEKGSVLRFKASKFAVNPKGEWGLNTGSILKTAALAAAIGISAPASATIVEAVYTGTVVDGVDVTGMFGTPNASP